MHEHPTADDVAIAIVAACRETGENPIDCATGAPSVRARHYALHSLLHVFPSLGRHAAARITGAPGGKGEVFWNNSWHQVAKTRPGSTLRMVNWWDEDSYGRVIAAIECRGHASVSIFQPSNEEEKIIEQPFRLVGRVSVNRPLLGGNVTSSLMGDPPPDRSALANAQEWRPYEAR